MHLCAKYMYLYVYTILSIDENLNVHTYMYKYCVCVPSSQGILFSTRDTVRTPMDFVRLWLHEASRVYGDKLIDQKDMDTFHKMKFEIGKQSFEVS